MRIASFRRLFTSNHGLKSHNCKEILKTQKKNLFKIQVCRNTTLYPSLSFYLNFEGSWHLLLEGKVVLLYCMTLQFKVLPRRYRIKSHNNTVARILDIKISFFLNRVFRDNFFLFLMIWQREERGTKNVVYESLYPQLHIA